MAQPSRKSNSDRAPLLETSNLQGERGRERERGGEREGGRKGEIEVNGKIRIQT